MRQLRASSSIKSTLITKKRDGRTTNNMERCKVQIKTEYAATFSQNTDQAKSSLGVLLKTIDF